MSNRAPPDDDAFITALAFPTAQVNSADRPDSLLLLPLDRVLQEPVSRYGVNKFAIYWGVLTVTFPSAEVEKAMGALSYSSNLARCSGSLCIPTHLAVVDATGWDMVSPSAVPTEPKMRRTLDTCMINLLKVNSRENRISQTKQAGEEMSPNKVRGYSASRFVCVNMKMRNAMKLLYDLAWTRALHSRIRPFNMLPW